MNANAGLLSLIGNIYDTTFDQALWAMRYSASSTTPARIAAAS